MDYNPAALAYISAVWITLAAWAAYNLLGASPAAPFNVAFDVLVVLAAAASRLLLVMCRPSLAVDDGVAAAHRRRPRLAGGPARRRSSWDASDVDQQQLVDMVVVPVPLEPSWLHRGATARATDAAAAAADQAVPSRDHGDATVECAVCLCVVEDGATAKRLPACLHLFHRRCIDTWLHGHSTCPVCRCSVFSLSPGQSAAG